MPSAQERIKQLKKAEPRMTLEQLAAQLNQEGLPSPQGGRWWPSTVSQAMRKLSLDPARPKFSPRALERILELKSPEVAMGLAEIGEILSKENIPTPQGGRWWPGTVRKALENAAEEGNERAKGALERETKRKIGQYGGAKATPQATLEKIVSLRKSGVALHKIAEQLTLEGVPTTRGGRKWWQSTVRSALLAAGYIEGPELKV